MNIRQRLKQEAVVEAESMESEDRGYRRRKPVAAGIQKAHGKMAKGL